MKTAVQVLAVCASLRYTNAVGIDAQLEHIAQARRQSLGFDVAENKLFKPSRRNQNYLYEGDILGAPRAVAHLPKAEPILPGQTLLRPAMGMLKSSIKFPHREWEDGSGVYGNEEHLGISYGTKAERVLYSKFRRNIPPEYIVLELPELLNLVQNSARSPTSVLKQTNDNLTSKILQILLERELERRKVNAYVTIWDSRQQRNRKALRRKLTLKENLLDLLQRNNSLSKLNVNEFLSVLPDEEQTLSTVLKTERDFQKKYSKTDNSPAQKDDSLENSSEEGLRSKEIYFMQQKNHFNHIKVNRDAPDFKDFLPLALINKEMEETKDNKAWWYYSQDDYSTLGNERKHNSLTNLQPVIQIWKYIKKSYPQ